MLDSYYFDNAATTKISSDALNSYIETSLNYPGNPSSKHTLGLEAKKELERARVGFSNILHTNQHHHQQVLKHFHISLDYQKQKF